MNVVLDPLSTAEPPAPMPGPPVLSAAFEADLAPELLRALRAELREQGERLAEVEADLRAAEDQIHRLEADLRSRNARIAELQRVMEFEAPAAAAQELPALDSMVATTPDMAALYVAADESTSDVRHRFSRESVGDDEHVTVHDPAQDPVAINETSSNVPEGAARFLVVIDGDTEVVHLLGRRTTIGRGTENDIRIDQSFVSRHHAILIAGPTQTVIEDLRSTNGVMVNDQRVRRCVLNDGDIVMVGKTQLRFALRRS